MPPWAKERRIGIWGSKGKQDISQEDGKSKCLVNKCFPGLAEKYLPMSLSFFLSFFGFALVRVWCLVCVAPLCCFTSTLECVGIVCTRR